MNQPAREHIERYAITAQHRAVAVALLESAPYDTRGGREWLALANNVVKALDAFGDDRVKYLRGRIERVLSRHDTIGTLCEADEYELREALKRLDGWFKS